MLREPLLAELRARGERVDKLVVVRASRIGDFICATPALRALRLALPQAEITLVALPLVSELARRSPLIDRFEQFPGFPGIAEQFFDARRAAALFARMQAEEFDLALQLHGSGLYSNVFTLMLGARRTAGFVRSGERAPLLDAHLPYQQAEHEVRRLLALTSHLGAPTAGEQTELTLWPSDRVSAERLLGRAPRPLIGVHPGGRDPAKGGRAPFLGEAVRRLVEAHGGTAVVIGTEEEREAGQQVSARCPSASVLDLVGQTSLPVAAAVVSRLDLLLANDSGIAHVAYALGTPSVTLFCSTDPDEWGPLDRRRHAVVIEDMSTCVSEDLVSAAEGVLRAV